MQKKILFSFFILLLFSSAAIAQKGGVVRGNIFDSDSGEPIGFANVLLRGTSIGNNTDLDGFFTLTNVPPGEYVLVASFLGYDSVTVDVTVKPGAIVYERLVLSPGGVQLAGVEVSARKATARSDVQISKVQVSASQIKSLPSTGGIADIAQYLPVLPGVVVSGDQGGQLYIRGGSPIQNKIMLDGMTIYNPFHSIGFFSVFETEAIKSADVLTGGFNAEYGGRISAVVDIKTREGNKKRMAGKIGASPFQVRALVEGPIKKLSEDGRSGSISYLLTGKQSLLDQTSKTLYSYVDSVGLPYQFTDVYGKLSFGAGNGSKLNLFGFNFKDNVDFQGVAKLNWLTTGGGLNFSLIPTNSNILVGGSAAFSDYDIALVEGEQDPRTSRITTYNIILDFNYFGASSEVQYGLEFNGFNTEFGFKNFLDLTIDQKSFTTELAGFGKYKQKIGNLIIEPGLRIQYYASQSQFSVEPRFGMKYNITDGLRFKAAGGMYSQNLVSTVNERDIVNLFVGFLAGPEGRVFKPGTTEVTDHRLQKSYQGVVGLEIDVNKRLELNIEPYYKGFTQLLNLNRNKVRGSDPDFQAETGEAYGLDLSARYEIGNTYLWGTYSYAFVNRDDGTQVYPTIFDRRHNANLLITQSFGSDDSWEASARWNFGTGFPFTQTQGYYSLYNFIDGINTNYIEDNANLGVIYSEDRNGGRLPDYHRLDVSLKKSYKFSKYSTLNVIASVTNAYDRENIFYFDRVRFQRVNQLPILPSLGIDFGF